MANPTNTALIIALVKKERLIASIAVLSVERNLVKKIPKIAVIIPIAGTING
ncbi:unannotated protein [freshwater metagenome]|uniref:Unannotated protein n=1 Tax=freshwater metagenome TaxID=449393 RepID=A0A6J6E0W0_9ZZZZ